jgi:hypothetical protein
MSPQNAVTSGHFADMEAKARVLFAKFEELRGFL